MPRSKKIEAVAPTQSLVASAVRYPGKVARIYMGQRDWQVECYRHYAICGEARFAARYMGHALSRATLGVGQVGKDRKVAPVTDKKALSYLDELFNGKEGQAEMLSAIGVHFAIAGECWLVGRTISDTEAAEDETVQAGQDVWEIVSVLEMQVNGNNWRIDYGTNFKVVNLTDDDVVIRLWIPDAARKMEADSPFKSLLPVLSEIEWATRHIFSQMNSRLTGAGILFLSQGLTFPPPPEVDGKPVEVANEAEAFMLTLADNMLATQQDDGNPSAVVPIIVTVPEEVMKSGHMAELMHFWSDLDEKAMSMRRDAILRFAGGMDLPPEAVLGMGSNTGTGGGTSNGVSHWGAWQVEESTIKMHVEPMLQAAVNSLTISYLRPLIVSEGGYTPGKILPQITYDLSALRLRPDRSKEALELYDRGLIGIDALLREVGFSVDDKMTGDELKRWLLVKIASGSATPEQVSAAARVLGVVIPGGTGQGEDTREARPAPSLEDHPTRPRTPGEDAPLLAAANALVYRALERAGNRIRQQAGVKPPGVPAHEMHILHTVNGSADSVLADAWSCAPQVLEGFGDVEKVVATLDAYCRSLFASRAPHSRDRLAAWLEKVH
jgi:hypothetical protein